MELVSIIIPAYNEAKHIEKAISSIQEQTYANHETIVVANNCADNTAHLARKQADLVLETDKQGISHAKNLGAKAATGQRIAFMDADSIAEPQLLQEMDKAFKEGYNTGKAKIRPLDDERIRAYTFCLFSEFISAGSQPFERIGSGAGAFTFMSKQLYQTITQTYQHLYNEELQVMEDMELELRLKKHGSYKVIHDAALKTSMRRFTEEGYWNCLVQDAIHGINPEGKTRARWNN